TPVGRKDTISCVLVRLGAAALSKVLRTRSTVESEAAVGRSARRFLTFLPSLLGEGRGIPVPAAYSTSDILGIGEGMVLGRLLRVRLPLFLLPTSRVPTTKSPFMMRSAH